MNVLLIDGSPANPSRVAKLLETVADGFKQNNCHIVTLSLHTLQLPINDPAFHLNPQEHPNESVRKLVTAVQAADIIVLGTPLYHGSYSGLLKMALDHLRDDAFGEKAVGLVSNADGPRNALQAAQELVLVARTMKGEVASCVIGTCHADYGMQNGSFQIIGPAILERITKFVDELTSRVR